MVKLDFNLVPKDALEYLRNKGYKLSFDYNELIKQAHNKSFTVAKITRLDLLHDMFKALDKAMVEGQHFKDFKKEIKPILQKKGWWGQKDIVNPKTGEVKTVNIGSSRLRNIYNTNMRVAYAQSRYRQQMLLPISTYLQYISALLEHTRVEHSTLHNTILPRTDIFWSTNYPPNGWGCVCKTRAISEKQAKKLGLPISKKAPKSVASKDWDYNPATQDKVAKLSKMNLDSSLAGLASVKSIRKDIYKDLTEEELQDKFYKTLALKKGDLFIDKVNDPMIIDDSLFLSASKYSKIKKQDRHLYLDEIARTIKDPHEVYLYFDEKNNRLLKKMFRYYKGEKQAKRAIQVAFEYLEDKTQGVTAYFVKDTKQVENRRYEKLIYQKGQE